MTTCQQVYYAGRVQGVGFRYSVKRIATGYEVRGWVRNLSDGRVEVQVGGEHGEVDAFLDAVANSHLAGHIKGIERGESGPAPGDWRGFEIRV